jgi:Caspase domain
MAQSFSHGYAVVVGVGADLPVTIDDARAISNTLIDPSRCAYPTDQVRLLTGEGARRDHIVSALTWLATSTGSADTAIVYFSGHGTERPDFYLVPYGFDWSHLTGTAISGVEFTALLRGIHAGKLLVLLDCCHAGGQAEAKNFIKSPMPINAFEELAHSSGRVVIASSRKDEASLTGDPYSQFTMAVIEAFAGFGAFERDGFARVLDLTLHVARFVPNRTGDKQHPIIKVSNLQDNFAIAWYAGGSTTPKALSWQASAPISSPIIDNTKIATLRRMLANYRENLQLIEEQISTYVEFTDVPLKYRKAKLSVEREIANITANLSGTNSHD